VLLFTSGCLGFVILVLVLVLFLCLGLKNLVLFTSLVDKKSIVFPLLSTNSNELNMCNFGDEVERVEFDLVDSVYTDWRRSRKFMNIVTSAKSSSYSAVSIRQKFR